MKRFLVAALFLAACHKGGLEEDCNPDGTCDFQDLECQPGGMGYRCFVRVRPSPMAVPRSEADQFCEMCLKRCGAAGLKHCAYTDVTVWGSKPTVCECRGDVSADKPHDGGK